MADKISVDELKVHRYRCDSLYYSDRIYKKYDLWHNPLTPMWLCHQSFIVGKLSLYSDLCEDGTPLAVELTDK